jgi:anthranilate synthase/aminodeoxychorismate synthase-like glutamine amidotransferase
VSRMRILVVDNYDSFTFNLVHAVAAQGAEVDTVRNDAIDLAGVQRMAPDGIVLSPGPGNPAEPRDFGVCADLVRERVDVPMLGVCLGMQGMAHHTGGVVVRAPRPVHGEASPVLLQADSIFAGLPGTIHAGRYHSLVVDAASLPPEWAPTARSPDGLLMAMAHRDLPWFGVQFHPESILTPQGPRLIRNFVEMCG